MLQQPKLKPHASTLETICIIDGVDAPLKEDPLKVQRNSGNRTLLAVAILALSATAAVVGQERVGTQVSTKEPLHQFVVLLKRGPNWIPGKSASEQPLQNHGKLSEGPNGQRITFQFAGQLLDDSGGVGTHECCERIRSPPNRHTRPGSGSRDPRTGYSPL